jgi:hypothetical protein
MAGYTQVQDVTNLKPFTGEKLHKNRLYARIAICKTNIHRLWSARTGKLHVQKFESNLHMKKTATKRFFKFYKPSLNPLKEQA